MEERVPYSVRKERLRQAKLGEEKFVKDKAYVVEVQIPVTPEPIVLLSKTPSEEPQAIHFPPPQTMPLVENRPPGEMVNSFDPVMVDVVKPTEPEPVVVSAVEVEEAPSTRANTVVIEEAPAVEEANIMVASMEITPQEDNLVASSVEVAPTEEETVVEESAAVEEVVEPVEEVIEPNVEVEVSATPIIEEEKVPAPPAVEKEEAPAPAEPEPAEPEPAEPEPAEPEPVEPEPVAEEPVAVESAEVESVVIEPAAIGLKVLDLIYWRDVKKTGVVFGSMLFILLSLAIFSVLSVVAYLSLAILAVTLSFRVYKNIMQAVQKSGEGHPFKDYLEADIELNDQKTSKVVKLVMKHTNNTVRELRRLFLVEDLVDTIKFGLLLWVLTYIGSWFNGMTLIINSVVIVFTLPKVYETYKVQIDNYLAMARSQFNKILHQVQSKLPFLKKKAKAQ